LALTDSRGNNVAYSLTGEDIREWIPWPREVIESLKVPSTLSPGSYEVLVAIIDPAKESPGIKLAIEGKREDGWYVLNTVTVKR